MDRYEDRPIDRLRIVQIDRYYSCSKKSRKARQIGRKIDIYIYKDRQIKRLYSCTKKHGKARQI